MKRLMLIVLLACPAIQAEGSILDAWNSVNNSRITSAIKALGLGILGGFSLRHCGRYTRETGNAIAKWNTSKNVESLENLGNQSVAAGGMGYTGYCLFYYAWKNAKHALAVK